MDDPAEQEKRVQSQAGLRLPDFMSANPQKYWESRVSGKKDREHG